MKRSYNLHSLSDLVSLAKYVQCRVYWGGYFIRMDDEYFDALRQAKSDNMKQIYMYHAKHWKIINNMKFGDNSKIFNVFLQKTLLLIIQFLMERRQISFYIMDNSSSFPKTNLTLSRGKNYKKDIHNILLFFLLVSMLVFKRSYNI